MNIQEREQLSQFLQQLTQVQGVQKDGDADALIREACLRQPDATYLLVQRAMLLDQAMLDSRTQITRLQTELDQARAVSSSGSFIDANAWGNSAGTRPAPQAAFSPAPPPAAPAPSTWGSGMMGNMAMTAAGVVAGGFLFQGIGYLLGNNGQHDQSSNSSTEPHEKTASNHLVDSSTADSGNAGVFDTSSVDSFIADEAGADDSA